MRVDALAEEKKKKAIRSDFSLTLARCAKQKNGRTIERRQGVRGNLEKGAQEAKTRLASFQRWSTVGG